MDWTTLLSTFGLVFIAELGDKTQLAVVTQTCKYRCPLPVFLGGSMALTAITALGVGAGQALGYLIPEAAIRMIAALAFVVMGGLIWVQSVRSGGDAVGGQCDCESDSPSVTNQHKLWNWQAFATTLTLLFLAELGDKTQLTVLGLAGRQSMPLPVFVGGALALTTVTALGVIGGQQLCKLIPQQLLLKVSAAAFAVMGVLVALGIL
ncbi:MAG: TMEM165/GDT1 family protein [Chloroflexota bacterium]|nr:TMEM165/GDT1 family protein [Chloroflexota bacterium]